MKKFFAVVICAVMIVSATACTGSNKGDNVESSAEIVNSTVSNDESSQAESNKDDSKMFASIQEYLEYPNAKKSIETMKSTLSTTLYDFDCYADGDALIYKYKFTKQISDDKLENVKNILDDTFEDMDSTLSALMEELLEYVDIENPIISVKYVNNDGSVITEKSFDKSILEETTSDVNSSDEKSV
ncbi:DUF4854 domain-containing protein [uncultured Ruminococcus sp.]|jgi:hypothetical protein|uniref:DUF4854 domain-containing protein n=1 Tax=uncultured Ruminococcus sp. TaxID=165186 RepID=UPI0026DBBC68|nr:DUF4854 domain-containing protein [uncultured Ruminococcus sp.]